MINQIHNITELKKLETELLKNKSASLIDKLYKELLQFSDYKNATQWNKAVRICESLTILGWGNYEPVQAIRSNFFNGNPMTGFYNKFSERRFVDAIWSKRKTGFTMEQGRTSYFESAAIVNKPTILHDYPVLEQIEDVKLETQRNWIPKNPISIGRYIQNCYENSLQLAEDIEQNLNTLLNRKMKPVNYGTAVNTLRILLTFSEATYHKFGNLTTFTQTNYVIADDNLKLKKRDFDAALKKMYSKEEIQKNAYWLRNRFEIGPFRSKTGKQTMHIYFDKQFSQQSYQEQKAQIIKFIIELLEKNISKLKKKKLDYDFDLMFDDFKKILHEWSQKNSSH